MKFPEVLWGLVLVGGPIILLLVMLWALLRNRAQRRSSSRTERATNELYRDEERARRD